MRNEFCVLDTFCGKLHSPWMGLEAEEWGREALASLADLAFTAPLK